jgi:murein L,D-transpeptidase YafK
MILIRFGFIILLHSSFYNHSDESFKTQQLKNARVKTAYSEKEVQLKNELMQLNVEMSQLNIFIRAFKYEKKFEMWVKNKSDNTYKFYKSYPFCTLSGTLGPKRKIGDNQTPEGFYYIDRFNPYSNFYLSLGINYPNASDKILGDKNPGGDIFIHGNCLSIGCIPITDEKIKELYLLCVEARDNGEAKIPVYIFPTTMSKEGMIKLSKYMDSDAKLKSFWENLKTGFDFFEKNHYLPVITIDKNGKYLFN